MSTAVEAGNVQEPGSDGTLSAAAGMPPATGRSLQREGVVVKEMAVSEQSAATDATVAKGLGLQCMPA